MEMKIKREPQRVKSIIDIISFNSVLYRTMVKEISFTET